MRKLLYHIPLCIAVFTLTACKDSGLSADEREERDPMVKTAVAYMEQNQWNEAEQALLDALDKDPSMAKPHLNLALIYQQYKPNYIHAIYHYDRYLELRPESEKASFIKEQRDKVMRALEVKAVQESPDVQQIVAEIQRLMKENENLKKQLASATSKPKQTSPTVVTDSTPSTPATTSSSKQKPSHQIYTAVSGDTLTKIANKFYGDSGKWDTIYEANRDTLASPSSLKVGQTLVIPMQGK